VGGRTIPAFDPLAPPPAAEGITFHLNDIAVVGNTVVSDEDLRALYSRFLGADVSVGQVFAIANSITALYGQRGYPLSRAIVPAQEIDGSGVVRLQVVEGFVDQVIVEGAGTANRLVKEHGEKLTGERPISSKTLERHLLLADDLPGLSARSVLRTGEEQGGTTVVLQTEPEKPFSFAVTVDNRGSEAVGPLQVDTRFDIANLLAPNSETNLRFVSAAASKELLYLTAEQRFVLNSEGTELSFGLKRSSSEPGTQIFQDIELETSATTAFLIISHPVIRGRAMNLEVHGAFEARNSETLSLGVPLSEDRIRSLRFGFDFDNTDKMGGLNTASFELSKGLSGFGASENGDPLLSRQFGVVNYAKLNLDLSRVQQLSVLSPALSSWSVYGQITAQLTNDPLLSTEECSLGGLDFGRAYESSTVSGDRCFAGSLEVRFQAPKPGVFDSLQFYGFYEGGSVSDLDPGTSTDSDTLIAAGLGARFAFMDRYSGSLEIAKQVRNDTGATDGSPQVFLSISGEF
jgi:hemolysin activation/secretion protein